jgi:hypothetical protein
MRSCNEAIADHAVFVAAFQVLEMRTVQFAAANTFSGFVVICKINSCCCALCAVVLLAAATTATACQRYMLACRCAERSVNNNRIATGNFAFFFCDMQPANVAIHSSLPSAPENGESNELS